MAYYNFDMRPGLETFIKQVRDAGNEISKGFTAEIGGFKPKIDIIENESGFKVFVELPGVNKSEVSVSVNEDRVLNIKGEKAEIKSENLTLLMNERKFGEFSRSLQLPEEADIEKIEAKFLNGILELIINKVEPVKPKVIEVKLS